MSTQHNDTIATSELTHYTITQCIGDLALLVDTSHPMIRPQLEKALDSARKMMQAHRRFCIQVLYCRFIRYHHHRHHHIYLPNNKH